MQALISAKFNELVAIVSSPLLIILNIILIKLIENHLIGVNIKIKRTTSKDEIVHCL
ncbi:MAG: hypothetical protein ACI93S_000944 [Ancylomarina sp.]|jgi:hypothetical protein